MAGAQPPQTVLIQGQLLDEAGAPIVGLRQYRVRFFDAESGGTQLGGDIVDTTVINAQGLFAIPVVIPADLIETPEIWYELAIDSSTPALGVGEEHEFPGRVRMHSVPYARAAHQARHVELEGVGDGIILNSEFNRLAGVTGNIQNQLDAKAEAAEVNAALALKAYAADVEEDLAQKANVTDVEAALLEKMPRTGTAHVVVEVTDDAVQNAANLLAAYAEAAGLTPNGQLMSANNRAVVFVPPGRYDLGTGQLLMDRAFVDLVGMSTAPENQRIFGASAGPNTGVLRQTANNVRIENLLVVCTRNTGDRFNDATDPAAYFPDSGLQDTVIRNCRFEANETNARAMRVAIEYAGTYEDVTAGQFAFGGFGVASGTFINCTGAFGAFGGDGGTASGIFINCTGLSRAFGGGGAGTASGTFTNCTGGSGAFGGLGGDASDGEFYYCIGGVAAFTTSGDPAPVHRFCVRDGDEFP